MAGKWYIVVYPSSLNQRNRTKNKFIFRGLQQGVGLRVDDPVGRREKTLRKGRLELAGTGRVSPFSGKLSSVLKAPGQTRSSPPVT